MGQTNNSIELVYWYFIFKNKGLCKKQLKICKLEYGKLLWNGLYEKYKIIYKSKKMLGLRSS